MISPIESLRRRMLTSNSLICCGLDPDPTAAPAGSRTLEDTDATWAQRFLQGVVDAVAPFVCAFKAQRAFFDALDGGWQVLRQVIDYVHDKHPGSLVLVDAKAGDTANTMKTIVGTVFDRLGADGIVLNPYMGDEVFYAIADRPAKLGVVLVRTSGVGSDVVQDLRTEDGSAVWERVLGLVCGAWNVSGNLMPVLGATARINFGSVRRRLPEGMPVLLAGCGQQGGDVSVVRELVDSTGLGVVVNSSRGLLYPPRAHGESWTDAAARAARQFRNVVNAWRSRP